MRLHLVFVGKTGTPELEASIGRYLERLKHYISTEVHLVKAERITSKQTADVVKEREAQRILSLIGKNDFLIAWDEHGKTLDSPGFAGLVERLMNTGISHVWSVTGGPLGIWTGLLEQADSLISLSRMTFPHDIARLVVVEQFYRAFTILKGEPYHK